MHKVLSIPKIVKIQNGEVLNMTGPRFGEENANMSSVEMLNTKLNTHGGFTPQLQLPKKCDNSSPDNTSLYHKLRGC